MQDIPTIMEDMCSQMHNVGNNRIVTDAHGNVEEVNHYYPYGALMCDSRNTGLQPYKYIGKERPPHATDARTLTKNKEMEIKEKVKSFDLTSMLGYPDSNQERQDQNLQCYHYTISQFVSSNCLLLICDCKGSAFFSYPKTFCAFFHKKFHFSSTLYHYSEN